MTILVCIASMVLLFMAVPVFMVFGIGSAASAILDLGLPWSTLIQVSFSAVTKSVLIAVPLFIFSGLAMLRGGIAGRLVNMTTALVGHWPGGLGIGMVLAMGFFAAFCGSILAAITAVGTIMMPKMIDQGYPAPFVIVLAAAAALLEALIPPSNAAIVFSALTNIPVSKTFAAGIFPGLVLMVLLIALVSWRCRHIRIPERPSRAAVWHSIREALPGLMTPIIILGGIYGGFLTPSETAAVAGIWAILVGFLIHRELTIAGLLDALRQTAIATAIIFSIILMNLVFSFDSILAAMALTEVFTLMVIAIVIGGLLMIWLANRVTEFLKKNRMFEVLGLFILFIVGIMLLSEGGHLAHMQLFGNEVTPMSKTTFYFVIGVLIVIDIVQSKYQKKLLIKK